jgi:hypothetical protein
VDHRIDRGVREVLRLGVERDGGESDPPVPADLARALRAEGLATLATRGSRCTFASIAATSERTGPDVTGRVVASTTIWSASPEAAGKSRWRMARAWAEGLWAG